MVKLGLYLLLERRHINNVTLVFSCMLACHVARTHVGVNTDDGVACFDNRLWSDAVLLIILELHGASALSLIDSALHRVGDFVGIHDYLTIEITSGATCCLG